MTRIRTKATCLRASFSEAPWSGRERAATQARLHLIAMPLERREMLEAEWVVRSEA